MTVPLVIAADPLSSLPPVVRWLMERSKPEPPALELLTPSSTLDSLYSSWIREKYFVSAIRMIAAVLPARESIWWAWVSARHATVMPGGTAPSKEAHDTLGAVEKWIVRPDDDTRRAAWSSGNLAGLDTPIGMVSAAVFLSGTSVAPPNVPAVPPPPGAAMPLIAGAVVMAGCSNTMAEKIPDTLEAFAAQGLEIVKRLGGWETALKTEHDAQMRRESDYARATAQPKPV